MYDNIPVTIVSRTDQIPDLDIFLNFDRAKKFPRSVPRYIDSNYSFVIARIIYTLAKYYNIPVTWKINNAEGNDWTLSIPEMKKEFVDVCNEVKINIVGVIAKYQDHGADIIPLLNFLKAMAIYYKWEDME